MTPEFLKLVVRNHRRMIIIATALLLLGILFSFTPTYVARYLIASTLDEFNIEHDGIKSLTINPWTLEVWAGPVRFRTGETDQGQIGELGIKVNLFPFFKKHAMIKRVLIRGVDIYIARAEDNTLTLNGIPLEQFQAEAQSHKPTKPQITSKPWGAGLGEFEMQDSRLIFKDKTGGRLTVQVDSLRLGDFSTRLPDEPGNFQLKASVNNIQLDINGEARPFARHITIHVDADAREADLPKITEFTGPFGFAREDGVYHSTIRSEITLFDTGRLEGHSAGKIRLLGADYAQANVFAFVTDQAEIELDTRYSLSKNDKLKIDGKLKLELVNVNGSLPGEDNFAIGSARINFSDLSATHTANKDLNLSAKTNIALQQGEYSGHVNLSMDALMDVLRYLQSLSATRKITPEQTGLGNWAGDKVTLPKSDITVKQLNGSVERFELSTSAGKVSLDMSTQSQTSEIKVSMLDRITQIDSTKVKLDALQVRSGEGKLKVNVNGKSDIKGFQIKGPNGTGLIRTIELGENIDLKIDRGDIAVQGSADANVIDGKLKMDKTDTLPEATFGVGSLNAKLDNASFSIVKQKLKWKVEASAKIEHALAEYDEGRISSAKIDKLEWQGAKADQNLNLATESLVIGGLDSTITRQFIDGLTSKKSDPVIVNGSENKENIQKESDHSQSVMQQIKLGRFELANGAKLRFIDKKVQPQVYVQLDIKTAKITDIDSRNPEKQAQASLLADINEFSHFELKGKSKNEGPKMDLTLLSKLQNLELPPYSSYSAEFAGVNLESGQLSSLVDVKANKGELDGNIKLNIKDLEFTPLSKADAERLSETTGVPVETAVRLLRDKDGVIDLSLPITGSIVAPDVDISSAISKAIGNTLKTVFPPTLIGSMLSSIESGGTMTFKPVLFKPGSIDLDKKSREYLDELSVLLKERPRLFINICGRSTPEDFKAATLITLELKSNPKAEAIEARQRLIDTHGAELRKLAIKRTHVVRRYMITEKGLNAGQIGECRAIFNPDDNEPPRVAIML